MESLKLLKDNCLVIHNLNFQQNIYKIKRKEIKICEIKKMLNVKDVKLWFRERQIQSIGLVLVLVLAKFHKFHTSFILARVE